MVVPLAAVVFDAWGEHVKSDLVAYAALIGLTLVSFCASFLHLTEWEMPVALTIAFVKVCIVGAVFMHLRSAPKSHLLSAFVAFGFVVLLTGLMATDVMMR